MELKNKVAIVTGGANGIGKAIAEGLAKEGAQVVIVDINISQAELTANWMKTQGMNCVAFFADISNLNDLQKVMDFTIKNFKTIDILVNNAGISQKVDIAEISEQDWDKVMNVNLKGMVFLSKLALMIMMEKKSGKIINIASLAGERGGQFAGIHYSASKAGVIVATKCLALKGGKYNINVNAIAPGLIKTELAEKLQFSTDEIAMGRLGSIEEVANVAVFLATDKASYITGATIDVNGGILMR